MTASGAYNISEANRSAEAEIARLRTHALLSWPKEARILNWFGLRDAMNVLEPGSGPGFITEQLLQLLPHSQITALDTDATLNQRSAAYLQGISDGRLRFREASVMDTGLPDNSFDFAIARFLFQHLSDPLGAALELRRTLKPGGKLVIIDIDDALWGMADPRIEEMATVLNKYGKAQEARGGNRMIGRHLGHIFADAGFQSFDIEAVAISSDTHGVEAFMPQIDADRMWPLVKAGRMTTHELEDLRDSGDRFINSAHPFIMMLTFMACGEKPGDNVE